MAYGANLEQIIYAWADFGVFAYLLPFLMIFAIVYGILSKSKILGENRGVNATISLAVGLLALQNHYVTNFYAMIFPYTGMAIAVLLVALILMGLISPEQNKYAQWIWFGIGAISFIFVLIYSFSDWKLIGGGFYGFYDSMPALAALALLLVVMGFIIWGGKD